MASRSYMHTKKLTQLLTEADPSGDHAVWIQNDRLVLGRDPHNPIKIIDFASEEVCTMKGGGGVATVGEVLSAPSPLISTRSTRTTGRYQIELKGIATECRSLKEVLAEGLKALEKLHRGTLDKLTTIKPRTKRIVARDAKSLFDQDELVQRYAEKLMDGWWFGTNNSADETNRWLKRGCELAGLQWGKDFIVRL